MITSSLNLLERGHKDKLDADANKFIHFAVDGAQRMKVLIQDLLSFSRVGRQGVCISRSGRGTGAAKRPEKSEGRDRGPRRGDQCGSVADNPGDVRMMQEAFREGGFSNKLNIARDEEQAMAYLNSSAPRPSLILLDLKLPSLIFRRAFRRIS